MLWWRTRNGNRLFGTVTDYLLDHDAYRIEYTDGHVDVIPFNDILKLLPKSWSKPRDSSNEEALNMLDESNLEEALKHYLYMLRRQRSLHTSQLIALHSMLHILLRLPIMLMQ